MKKEKKHEKTNPVMEQKNLEKLKMKDTSSVDDENVIKKLVIITLVIVVVVGIVFGLTELLKKDNEKPEEIVKGSINYNTVTVGTILNRPYEEYYVLIYNFEDKDAVLYSTTMTKYMEKSSEKDYVKIYYCDLNNKLNSSYYNVNEDNKSNPNAKTTKDFDFSDVTLIKIKNGKITKYVEDYKEIKELLK